MNKKLGQELEKRMIDLLPDFKICPNCGKKFTKKEYIEKMRSENITNPNRLAFLWKKKRFCEYDCSTKFHSKTSTEKILTEIEQNHMKFTAPIEVWDVERCEIKDIIVKLYGEDILFRRIGPLLNKR